MAPLFSVVEVEYASTSDDQAIYKAFMDPEWTTGGVPHGGYVLSQVLEALIAFQLRVHPEHPDPFNISAHYLNRNSTGPCEIRIKDLKHGRTFTNLTAEFIQQGRVNLTAHSVFGSLALSKDNKAVLNVEPPSLFARRLPLYHHPSQSSNHHTLAWKAAFYQHIKISEDENTYDRNKPDRRDELFDYTNDGPNSKAQKVGGGGVECGRWIDLQGGENDHIRPSLIPFLVDMQLGFPVLLPDQPPRGHGWQATLVLTIQFFFPIPKAKSPHHASHTVGVYGRSNFLAAPHARYDGYAEVWTAPTNIGEGEPEEGWREKQVCLASATQMSVAMPMALTREKPKL